MPAMRAWQQIGIALTLAVWLGTLTTQAAAACSYIDPVPPAVAFAPADLAFLATQPALPISPAPARSLPAVAGVALAGLALALTAGAVIVTRRRAAHP
jgi:hypothetical protein